METTINFFTSNSVQITFFVLFVINLIMALRVYKSIEHIVVILMALAPTLPLILKGLYDFIVGQNLHILPWIWLAATLIACTVMLVLFLAIIRLREPRKGIISYSCLVGAGILLYSFMVFNLICNNLCGRIGFLVYIIAIIVYVKYAKSVYDNYK